MLRTVLAGVVLVGFVAGIASAEELTGVITKLAKNRITVKAGTNGAEKTYELATDVKVYRFRGKTEKELDPDGLKADPLPNLPKGGVFSIINLEDGKVTEIRIPPKKTKN